MCICPLVMSKYNNHGACYLMHMSVYLDGHLVMCVYERGSSRVSKGGRESDASLQYVAPDGGAVCFSEVLGV